MMEETHKVRYDSGSLGWIYLPEFQWRLAGAESNRKLGSFSPSFVCWNNPPV